jgi:hypothetical protein
MSKLPPGRSRVWSRIQPVSRGAWPRWFKRLVGDNPVVVVREKEYVRIRPPAGVTVVRVNVDWSKAAVGASEVFRTTTTAGRDKLAQVFSGAVRMRPVKVGFAKETGVRDLEPDTKDAEAAYKAVTAAASPGELENAIGTFVAAIMAMAIPCAADAIAAFMDATVAKQVGRALVVDGVGTAPVPRYTAVYADVVVAAAGKLPPWPSVDQVQAHKDAVMLPIGKALRKLGDAVEWTQTTDTQDAVLVMKPGVPAPVAYAIGAALKTANAIVSFNVRTEENTPIRPPAVAALVGSAAERVVAVARPQGIIIRRGTTYEFPLGLFKNPAPDHPGDALLRGMLVGKLTGARGELWVTETKARARDVVAPGIGVAALTPTRRTGVVIKSAAGGLVAELYDGVPGAHSEGRLRDITTIADRMVAGKLTPRPRPCVGGMFGYDYYTGGRDKMACPYARGDGRIQSACAPHPETGTPASVLADAFNCAVDIEELAGASTTEIVRQLLPPCMDPSRGVASLSGYKFRLALAGTVVAATEKMADRRPAQRARISYTA